jgi:hypothetical protein
MGGVNFIFTYKGIFERVKTNWYNIPLMSGIKTWLFIHIPEIPSQACLRFQVYRFLFAA